jgi:hypothetical protein
LIFSWRQLVLQTTLHWGLMKAHKQSLCKQNIDKQSLCKQNIDKHMSWLIQICNTYIHCNQSLHKSNPSKSLLTVQEVQNTEGIFHFPTKAIIVTNIRKLYLVGLFLACGATPPAALVPLSLPNPLA